MKSLLFAVLIALPLLAQAQMAQAKNSCELKIQELWESKYDANFIRMQSFSKSFERGSDADSVANQSIARNHGLVVIDAEDTDLEKVLGEDAFYQATAYIDSYSSGINGEYMNYLVTNPQTHAVGLIFQMVELFGPGQPVAYSYMFFSVSSKGARIASFKGPLLVDQVAEMTNISDDPDSEKFATQLARIGAEVEDAEDYDLQNTLPWVYEQYSSFVAEIQDTANSSFEAMNYFIRDDSGQIVGLIYQQTESNGYQLSVKRAFYSLNGTILRQRKFLSASN